MKIWKKYLVGGLGASRIRKILLRQIIFSASAADKDLNAMNQWITYHFSMGARGILHDDSN